MIIFKPCLADEFCPEESVFSNNMVGATNAYNISDSYTYYQQFVNVEDPFGSVTFWVCYVNAPPHTSTIEYSLNSPQTVTITFYNQFGKQVDLIIEKRPKEL